MALVNQYKNNAAGKLLAAITAVSTSCTLQSGQGSNFPTADGTSTKFLVTLVKSTGEREICVCKRTAGSDVITFIDVTTGNASVNGRAQEGTSALTFSADDQVELRLTAAQITSFEEEIDTLQTTVAAIDADYLDSDHLPGGADEDDHDTRYYTQAQLWTQTELSADNALGIDMGNITANRSDLAHSEITDDEATKHRLINDSAGNGDTTELWSADKIYDELALKSDSTHTHPDQNSIQLYADYNTLHRSYDFISSLTGYSTVGVPWGTNCVHNTGILTGNLSSFSTTTPIHVFTAFLQTNIDRLRWSCWYAADDRDAEARVAIYAYPGANAAVGATEDTSTVRTLPYDNNDPDTYNSASESISISSSGWYIIQFQMRSTDPTPGRYGCGAVSIYLFDDSYS